MINNNHYLINELTVTDDINQISSVTGGYNKYFERYKIVGEYSLKDFPNLNIFTTFNNILYILTSWIS